MNVPPPAECPIGRGLAVAALLSALTLIAYWPACADDFDFVNFDDGHYVVNNQQVLAGLTAESVSWSLTTVYFANWQPLTWLSLQADTEFFGSNPRVYHRTNVALHVANVVLLFFALQRLTGAVWRSAIVAALWAIHPLHVESVAWISERKDVLSTFFLLLSLLAYARYTSKPTIARFVPVFLGFIFGLAAKPMVITLPFLFCLIDYWPLRRLPWMTRPRTPTATWQQLFWEKFPLLAIAWLTSELTLAAQLGAESPLSGDLEMRVGNALNSYVQYLAKTIWPSDLIALYPYPDKPFPVWHNLGTALLLITLCALAVWQCQRRPYLFVGWFWFLGTLLPVIGLVQVGRQAMADRYTYIPHIGLFIALVWGAADLLAPIRKRSILFGIGAVVGATLIVVTRQQVRHWKDGGTLWSHCLAVNDRHPEFHRNLINHLALKGRFEEAERASRVAIELTPQSSALQFQRAALLRELGQTEAANEAQKLGLKLWIEEHPNDQLPDPE